MDTSKGTLALTDFGFNASMRINDNFRVGAQFYDRNVGRLGNWKPELDWAVADYRFKDWFGVRAGKVKTVVGLCNDTQDMEFLHTWALMPQSTYPVDVRGDTIAHVGADLYGNITIKRLGGVSYTLYGGAPGSTIRREGTCINYQPRRELPTPTAVSNTSPPKPKRSDHYGGPVYSADLRWTTPVKGLLVGASYMRQNTTTTGYYLAPTKVAYRMTHPYDPTTAFYTEYTLGNLRVAGEYRREAKQGSFNAPTGAMVPGDENARSGYVSAAYRFSKWLQLGTYHSRYVANRVLNHGDPKNHVFDQTVTARVDLRTYLDFKLEGHFIDGAMINSALDRSLYCSRQSIWTRAKDEHAGDTTGLPSVTRSMNKRPAKGRIQ